MRWVLSEGPRPDEPGLEPDEHMGQWLLPMKRNDVTVFEPDTVLERDLWDAVFQHYQHNDQALLEKLWPKLKEIYDMGLYHDFLKPLEAPAYRGLTGTNPEHTAKILGISLEEVRNSPVGKVNVIESSGTYTPKSKISSWTQNLKLAKNFMVFGHDIEGGASIILRAAPGAGNEFMMNVKRMPDHFIHIEKFGYEEEVISYGPVKWDKAAWVKQPKIPGSFPWDAMRERGENIQKAIAAMKGS